MSKWKRIHRLVPWRELGSVPWRELGSVPWRELGAVPWRELGTVHLGLGMACVG